MLNFQGTVYQDWALLTHTPPLRWVSFPRKTWVSFKYKSIPGSPLVAPTENPGTYLYNLHNLKSGSPLSHNNSGVAFGSATAYSEILLPSMLLLSAWQRSKTDHIRSSLSLLLYSIYNSCFSFGLLYAASFMVSTKELTDT